MFDGLKPDKTYAGNPMNESGDNRSLPTWYVTQKSHEPSKSLAYVH